MKKFLLICLSLFMVFALVACSSGGSGGADQNSQPQSESSDSEVSDENSESSKESSDSGSGTADGAADASKVLIAYYSATGNTKAVAEDIAAQTGGELFELTPVEPYTEEDLDYSDESSRVSMEHESLEEVDVPLEETTVPNWDSFDTVFIGYPIWWGEAAWPVNEFVTSNNFEGKTVIPFATSASSGIGNSAENLAEMAGSGQWQEGERFPSNADEEQVKTWLSEIGY